MRKTLVFALAIWLVAVCGVQAAQLNKVAAVVNGQVITMYFQDVILTLQNYWAKQGCVIEQPSGVECGAGTFNPNTFLRVIGPEPWSVAYVEPSRRPTDGRYGENPNRLQRYFQFQVIMACAGKPQHMWRIHSGQP